MNRFISEHFILFMAIMCLFCDFFFKQSDRQDTMIKMCLVFVVCLIALICNLVFYMCSKGETHTYEVKDTKNKNKKIVKYIHDKDDIIKNIIFFGFVLRLIYVLFTSVVERQNDAGTFVPNEGGHLGYIFYLYDNGKLPDFNPLSFWQYYHPPLHHILAALWVKINTVIGVNIDNAVENIQFLGLFYSICTMYVADIIAKEASIKRKGRIYIVMLLCFYPYLIMMSGVVNNDVLVTLLVLMTIMYMQRWFYNSNWNNIIKLALCLGLATMTKLSALLLAPAMAFVFIYKLMKDRNISIKDYLLQFAAFLGISVPIATWFQFRNFIKFNIPLGYVPNLGDNSWQYLDMGAVRRLFDFSFSQFRIHYMIFDSSSKDCTYNIFIALLKYAAFNEQSSKLEGSVFGRVVAYTLLLTMAVLSIFLCIEFFKLIKKSITKVKDDSFAIDIFYLLNVACIMISYVSFCLKYKHICSMNIRYVIIAVIIIIIMGCKKMDMKDEQDRISGISKKVTVLFCVLSMVSFGSMLF